MARYAVHHVREIGIGSCPIMGAMIATSVARFAAAAWVVAVVSLSALGDRGNAAEPAPVARNDGAMPVATPERPQSAQNPAYSPDGSLIVFTQFHNGYNIGPSGLFILDRSVGRITRLVDDEGNDNVNLPGSCWNGPRELITFSSDREDRDEIWTISTQTGARFRVTRHADGGDSLESSLSPDGDWIVFEVSKEMGGSQRAGTLWKIRADGSDLTRLTGQTAQWDDRQPNWSPRGDRVVFQRRPIGADNWGLYMMDPKDGTATPLLVSEYDHSDVAWSPDGRWVVFSSTEGNLPNPQIFVLSRKGGIPVRVTFDTRYSDSAPSWSPDGATIAFESHETDESPASIWQIAAPPLPPGRPRPVRR